MSLATFEVEKWMTDHEGDCRYNLTDTCVEALSISQFEELADLNLNDTLTHIPFDYGSIVGSNALKEAILSMYKKGSYDEVTMTQGANNANELVMMALLNEGDHVITLTPTYQQFYSFPERLGCTYDLIELKEENNWYPTIQEFRNVINDKTKMIILNSPNNPTGTVIKQELMEELIELAREYDCFILVDEIYRGLIGSRLCDSISDMYEKGIATSSFSKIYSFAGLRFGWIKGPKEVIDAVNLYRDYTIISTGPFTDYMATMILTHRDVLIERSKKRVSEVKAVLKAWLAKEKRFSAVIPEDGTVCFLKYHFDIDSKTFCDRLQKETGVFFVPGICFNCEYHVRFGFTFDPKMVEEGLDQVSLWLDKNNIY